MNAEQFIKAKDSIEGESWSELGESLSKAMEEYAVLKAAESTEHELKQKGALTMKYLVTSKFEPIHYEVGGIELSTFRSAHVEKFAPSKLAIQNSEKLLYSLQHALNCMDGNNTAAARKYIKSVMEQIRKSVSKK